MVQVRYVIGAGFNKELLLQGEVGSSSKMWRVGDEASRLLLDVVAGRSPAGPIAVNDSLMNLAHRHGLLGMLAESANPSLRDAAFPGFIRWSSRQKVMKRHVKRFLLSFAEAGIQAALLKGPYLAEFAYRNPRLRLFTDIDLLVRRQHLDRALEVIGDDASVYSIPRKRPRADKREVPITDPDTGIIFNLDVHWDLFSYTQLQGCAAGATGEAWDRAVGPVDTGLGPLWHLPEDARLAFLCTHALLDHRFRMILFRDLAEIADRPFAWELLIEFANRWDLRSTTYLSLLISARTANAAIPDGVLEELRLSNTIVKAIERLLPRTDLIHFDGHRPHPLNLAVVLLHDDFSKRATLLVRAPVAFPNWRKRVEPTIERSGKHRLSLPRSVTVVVASDRRRGAEVFGERLRDGLLIKGWETELVSLASEPGGRQVGANPISDRIPGEVGRIDGQVVRGLARHLRQRRPGVVLANGSSTLQYSVAAVIGVRPRPLLVYCSIGEPLYWLRKPGQRLIQKLLLSRVDLIVAVSQMTRDQLVENLGVAADRVEVAHTGVPRSFFEIVPQPRGDRFRILFMGNLSIEKDPGAALEVLLKLDRTTPAELRFVGSGPLQTRLQQRVRSLGLADRVEFWGSVDDVRPHLAWADALLLCSETEGLPGAVLEAAAAGVPTVGFDVGGTGETIVDGVTGRLLARDDRVGAVEVLRLWAEDEQTRRATGEAASQFAAERFSLEASVDLYHELLADRLSRHGSG